MFNNSMPWASKASSAGSGCFPQPGGIGYNGYSNFGPSFAGTNSAVDMKQLTDALSKAREGTGEVRSTLLKAAFRPRLPGLTKMVSKLSKEGAWRKALEVYEAVEELGVRPDTALTNSAISACDKGGRWQKALEIFDRMDAMRLPRDAITYSACISALAKGKQWHAALQVFDHMQNSGVDADVVTCCSLINALERGGQWQLAEKLFLEMCTVPVDDSHSAPTRQYPPGLFTQAAAHPGRLMRSQTSPTHVLNALRTGIMGQGNGFHSSGKGTLPSVTESEPALSSSPHEAQSSLASAGILSALKPQPLGNNGADENTGAAANRASAENGVDGLASAFAKAATITPAQGQQQQTLSATSQSFTPDALAAKLADLRAETAHGSGSLSQELPPGIVHNGPTSQLQRSGSLLWETNTPVQAETAAHLRRAISCFPDVATGNAAADSKGVASMFNFSHAARVTPNRVCCNALLAAYARAKPPQWQKALHLLAAMWSGGPALAPDPVSYNTVIKACASSFQLGKALDVYREMTRRGVPPNVTTYNALISVASDSMSGAVLQEIGAWLDAAPADVRSPCANTYIAGLAKVGLWDEAMKRYHDMLSPGSPTHPTPATFNTIMTGYMHMGNFQAVLRTFDEMRAVGVAPTIVAYNTLLNAHANMGSWAEAMDVLRVVLGSSGEGIHANTATFNTVLAALAKGIAITDRSQHAYLATHAIAVFNHMQQVVGAGVVPDSATFSAFIFVLEATGEHSAHIVAAHDMMLAVGVTPDCSTAAAILKAAMACGQTARAVQGAHALQLQGAAVDAPLLTSLLGSCLAAGAWDLAMRLCSSTQVAQGSAAAAVMFNFVLHSALTAGQYQNAMEVLDVMQAAKLEVEPTIAAKLLVAPKTEGSGSSRQSSAGSSQGPFQDAFAPRAPAASHLKPDTPNGTASVNSGSFSAGKLTPPAPPKGDSTPGATISSNSPSRGDAHHSLTTTSGDGGSGESGRLTVADANVMLGLLRDGGDVQGAVEVLSNMKLAGMWPDAESYHLVMETLLCAGQVGQATDVCMEGHADGVLQHFTLPDTQAIQNAARMSGQGGMLRAVSGVVNVERCSPPVAAVVWMAWAKCIVNLKRQGFQVEDPAVVVKISEGGPAAPAASVDNVARVIFGLLTTGQGCLPGVAPVIVPNSAVIVRRCDGGACTIEIKTAAVYACM